MTGWNGCPFTVIRNRTSVEVYSSLLDDAGRALALYRQLREEIDPPGDLRWTYNQSKYRIVIDCRDATSAERVRDDVKRLAEQDALGGER